MSNKPYLFFLFSLLLVMGRGIASDIIDISPLHNKVILIHFKDGTVNYPNDLIVDRLDTKRAQEIQSYEIISRDDANYKKGAQPMIVGRKSKGTKFTKGADWFTVKGHMDPTSEPWASEHWIYLKLPYDLISGKTYTVRTSDLAKNGQKWTFTFDEKKLRSDAIHTNTLGYAPEAPKFGYIYQWMGDMAGAQLSSFDGNEFGVYKTNDPHVAILSGNVQFRRSALNVETTKWHDTPNRNFLGSEVYECDFSALEEPGEYFLTVEGIGKSYPFKIGQDPIWPAYYHGMRALYFQRSGIRKEPPYTEAGFFRPVNQNTLVTDNGHSDTLFQAHSFKGQLLYSKFPFMNWEHHDNGGETAEVIRESAKGNNLDVAGWYHDAGDWDQYYTHQRIPIILLLTYEYAQNRFADDELDIPESGNGVADIVDEASWLIKFNYRLRKELIKKGFSDGGVGGARICPDVYHDLGDNKEVEENVPSWQDPRPYVVSQADAIMTYFYAGQAAHFAMALKKSGKNPEKWPVELLDAVRFSEMTYDTVNWLNEALSAFDWASNGKNQPESTHNYESQLSAYRAYAAVNLYRITGEGRFHQIFKEEIKSIGSESKLLTDQKWAVFSYLLADNVEVDQQLQTELKQLVLLNADIYGMKATRERACRWAGEMDMTMLVGHATTPWVLELIIAGELTKDKKYIDAVHTTVDYFLGSNPLHTTWMVGVGPMD